MAYRRPIPHPFSQSSQSSGSGSGGEEYFRGGREGEPRSAYRAAFQRLQPEESERRAPFVVRHVNERSIYDKELPDYRGVNRPPLRGRRVLSDADSADERPRRRGSSEEEEYDYATLDVLRNRTPAKGKSRSNGGVIKPKSAMKGSYLNRPPPVSRFRQKLNEVKSYIQMLKTESISSASEPPPDSGETSASSISFSGLFGPPPPPSRPTIPQPFLPHAQPVPLRRQPFIMDLKDAIDASENRKRFYGQLGHIYTMMLGNLEEM